MRRRLGICDICAYYVWYCIDARDFVFIVAVGCMFFFDTFQQKYIGSLRDARYCVSTDEVGAHHFFFGDTLQQKYVESLGDVGFCGFIATVIWIYDSCGY